MYDITKRASFESLQVQINNFLTYSRNHEYLEFDSEQKPLKNIILVGTKLDLVKSGESQREVQMSEAIQFVKINNLSAVIETSAKDDLFISDCFYISAINCLESGFISDRLS